MYATCLFCNGALGRNESIEHFPIGRRLAFDGARGRLWVVCPTCARWNLSPLGTRWEAIEDAERAYRVTPNALGMLGSVFTTLTIARQHRVLRSGVKGNDGSVLRLTTGDASSSRIMRMSDDAWYLRVGHRVALPRTTPLGRLGKRYRTLAGYTSIHGPDAVRALATMLPAANFGGGGKKKIDSAVSLVLEHGDISQSLLSMRSSSGDLLVNRERSLIELPAPVRLALEMSLHEADERRALEGDLRELETRWREAEEIANIADGLLIPQHIDDRIERLRARE